VQPKAFSVNPKDASNVGISEARSTQVSSNQIGIEQDDSFQFSACQFGSEQIDRRQVAYTLPVSSNNIPGCQWLIHCPASPRSSDASNMAWP
jgi:hypothetical protein